MFFYEQGTRRKHTGTKKSTQSGETQEKKQVHDAETEKEREKERKRAITIPRTKKGTLFFLSLLLHLFSSTVDCDMSEHQAQDLLLQAEKKLNSWTWFNSTNKQEDAAEIYEKAGNTFKLAQRCMFYINIIYRVPRKTIVLIISTGKDAGNAYVKAAELYKTTPDLQYESSKSFENAAKCLKRIDAEGIIIIIYTRLV